MHPYTNPRPRSLFVLPCTVCGKKHLAHRVRGAWRGQILIDEGSLEKTRWHLSASGKCYTNNYICKECRLQGVSHAAQE